MDDVINYQYHIKFTCYVLSRGYLLEQMILLKYLSMCSMLKHASKKQQFYQKMSVAIYVIFKHDKIDLIVKAANVILHVRFEIFA